jgi:ATP-dependent helicase YprA (DUF1998 family)
MDALATSGLIVESYRRYLRSLLPVREPRIAEALAAEITRSPMLTKGPLLEATPPYTTGATLRRLIEDGVLDPAFSALASRELPLDRPLYRHQEQALRKAVQGRNLVVATGTGSGKTESFLLPILNSLIAEQARGELGSGVRALLLYPMNALANDQLKRLRQLLAKVPQITFGRYTGDTRERAQEAADLFEALNPGQPRLPNELLSRSEMRATPPHLLLTNYAMLEYLLLRPADLDLFEGQSWRFIALDEAHVYDGAKAAELAMLLRRLRDRVAPDQELQCIATSATVGDDPTAVTDFATKLFGVPFEWEPSDASRQDLVRATRATMPAEPFWGPLSADAYRRLAEVDDAAADVLVLAKEHGFAGDDPGEVLAHERTMAELRGRLAGGPATFAELARLLFDPREQPEEALSAVVTVGSKVCDKAGSPVLSARYHLFARATEGAFTCLTRSGPHVSLGRHEICEECRGAMFEFGACKRCGAVHLTGSVRHGDGGPVFMPKVKHDEQRVWLLLGDVPVVADEDDEDIEKVKEVKGDPAVLCSSCGGLYGPGGLGCARAGCDGGALWPVWRLNTRSDSPTGCGACGARGAGMVRLFESGNDAAVAVLGSALYQALPPAQDAETADQPGEGRKLLSFSDSRQAAAFFAPYFESSYQTIQHRRLILEGLRAGTRDDEVIGVGDLTFHVAKAADRVHVFERRQTRQQREREVALWVMQELVAMDDRQSLEGLGLLRVELDRDRRWPVPVPLQALGLSDGESWNLLGELLRTLRQSGVIDMPDGVDARDEAFNPRTGPIYVREEGSEPNRKVLSWLPTRGSNRRLDYIQRVLSALDSKREAKEVLRGCWKAITKPRDGWLSAQTLPGIGTVRQGDHTWLRLAPPNGPVYRCDACRRLAPVSVRGVCPTMACRGRLEPFEVPAVQDDDNHYRSLYHSMTPVPLVAREHTAQWTSLEAAAIQQQFLRGEVNMLSCSTTFELGVDVGELQAVLLRNMPPTTANYVQRAGRAGRRTDSAALVVTYAQRRSHDLSRFQDPVTMIAGEVRAPYVPLGNERIDRRHAHSIALAAFFRHARDTTGETWSTAGDFFLPGINGTPASRVRDFLTPVPRAVLESLLRVLPAQVQREIGVNTGEWVEELAKLLEEIRQQLVQDVEIFEARRRQAYEERKDHLVARYAKTINTLTQRNLLGYLANRNVLPKYGFPVDTVELRTSYSGEAVGAKLELTRDLSAAIYEYAPGSEIVAGGLMWRSGGVYRLPGRELISKYYLVCDHCQHYREGDDKLDPICPLCSTSAKGALKQYCVPEFGFVAEAKAAKTGTTPPKRSWNGTTHVLSLAAEEVEEYTWRTPNGGTLRGRAGSRGRLIAVSEGSTGHGYLICEWCGAGAPLGTRSGTHTHLLRGTECSGPWQVRSLAHPYETDILDLSFDDLAMPLSANTTHWRSTLYALLEGAAERLELSRDDIDGALFARPGGRLGIVMFDAVPGGAGSVLRIARALDRVAGSALARVSSCDCGEETSCYGCLRSFRNQRYHEELRRGAAATVLSSLMDDGGLVSVPEA